MREIARGRLPNAAPSTRAPLSAKVEKARAISSGLTGSAPRPIAKYGFRCRVIPMRCAVAATSARSEEHTSELQSQFHLVCRLLLEKKKKKKINSLIDN